MQAILSVFSGEARLADAPDQVFETTTTAPSRTTSTDRADDEVDEEADDEAADELDEEVDDELDDDMSDGAATTLPVIEVEENTVGIVPDRTVVCN